MANLNMQGWHNLLVRLRALEEEHGLVAVALSGGLDSRFLVHATQKAGVDALLLHAVGPHMPARESQQCRAWVRMRGLHLHEVAVDTLELDGVRNNSRERCYHCKRRLLDILWSATHGKAAEREGKRVQGALARAEGNGGTEGNDGDNGNAGDAVRAPHRAGVLCDGTNGDDLRAFRPGLRALREAGVRSPLAEAGLSKAHLRALGAATGLEEPEQVARPCLLTRLNYGLTPERELLRRVEAAEHALEDLGLQEFRLRICPEPVLQTHVLAAEIKKAALELLQAHGFVGATVLEEEHVGGFFDR